MRCSVITQRELRLIFDMSGPGTIDIGTLQQDPSIHAYINVDDMVRKHFAVFGTTGVGKSSGVAVLVRQILDARPDLRVFLIDPHNEYGHCFDDRAQTMSPKNLKLPFWLFNFEEIVDVFFRGRPGVDEEVEILSEVIPIAKVIFQPNTGTNARRLVRNDPKSSGVTVDTPVPYRLEDLIRLIDERMGKLENRAIWAKYHRLITRIETARNDPRYGFMFDNANVGGDTMVETLAQLFRLPPDGIPMTIMQLAGFPAEVVDSVVSVLLRMAFEFGLWSDGAFPLLCRLRGGAPLRAVRPHHRFRPDPQGGVAHRQGRPQVRRVPRADHAAPGRARRHHHLAMLHAVRDAHGERPRPGDRALGRVGRGRLADRVRSLIGHARSVRVRRRRRAPHPAALQAARRARTFRTAQAVTRAHMDSAKGVDVGFLVSVVERWRGATMSNQTRARPGLNGGPDDFSDLDVIAGSEFSKVQHAAAPALAPAASAATSPVAAAIRKSATNPESFFFPVDDGKPRLRR